MSKSFPSARLVNSEMFAQLSKAGSHATNRKIKVGAFVAGILLGCGPSNIQGPSLLAAFEATPACVMPEFIRPAVKFECSSALSKHSDKISEVLQALAKLDADCAVTVIFRAVRVVASLDHLCPRNISMTVPHSVSGEACFGEFLFQASARLGMTSMKALIESCKGVAAIALNTAFGMRPSAGFDIRLGWSEHNSSSKADSDGARFEWHDVRLSISNVVQVAASGDNRMSSRF